MLNIYHLDFLHDILVRRGHLLLSLFFLISFYYPCLQLLKKEDQWKWFHFFRIAQRRRRFLIKNQSQDVKLRSWHLWQFLRFFMSLDSFELRVKGGYTRWVGANSIGPIGHINELRILVNITVNGYRLDVHSI